VCPLLPEQLGCRCCSRGLSSVTVGGDGCGVVPGRKEGCVLPAMAARLEPVKILSGERESEVRYLAERAGIAFSSAIGGILSMGGDDVCCCRASESRGGAILEGRSSRRFVTCRWRAVPALLACAELK
jgi:hypothetical protein